MRARENYTQNHITSRRVTINNSNKRRNAGSGKRCYIDVIKTLFSLCNQSDVVAFLTTWRKLHSEEFRKII